MSTRKHIHEIELAASPERVFAILHTPTAICKWWGAARAIVIPRAGGCWAVAWGDSEDDPDYITVASIESFDPPRTLLLGDYLYFAREGELPFQANLVTRFSVVPQGDGSTLRVEQDGFPKDPKADSFYQACERGWTETFESIRRYLSTGG
jgi:uncharacterized protein YndB with AHSA1/START domain